MDKKHWFSTFLALALALITIACSDQSNNHSNNDIITVFDFDDLKNNDIYLVKVNTSRFVLNASNTGSVQDAAPGLYKYSGRSSDTRGTLGIQYKELPITGRPFDEHIEFPIPESKSDSGETPLRSLAVFSPPVLNSTKSFWVETFYGSYSFIQIQATLLAIGKYCNIWINKSSISESEAQAMADQFDIIYPAATNILGYEYGGKPGHNQPGGMDGDPKIQILIYDILDDKKEVAAGGYFWGKDFYTDAQTNSWWGWRSNEAEIFYLDANHVKDYPLYASSVLVHEFQHMINFNEKFVEKKLSSSSWYNEMLSMMTEDVIADLIGIPQADQQHIIQQRMPDFNLGYAEEGITEWGGLSAAYSYATKYAFGAYLLRNYGGADLLKRILANNTVDITSITSALNEISSGLTFDDALMRYGEALIFSNPVPDNTMSFNKTVENTINGTKYTAYKFDILDIVRRGGTAKGPVIYNLTQRTMRPHSITIHSSDKWKNVSGNISITLQKPADSGIELILIVK